MKTHVISHESAENCSGTCRASIGGHALLPPNTSVDCQTSEDDEPCARPMALFFQLDIEERFGLPFKTGSHLCVFACPEHDDPCDGRDLYVPPERYARLPEGYWDRNEGQLKLLLIPPSAAISPADCDPYLVHSHLKFEAKDDDEGQPIGVMKIGGYPAFCQAPELWKCSCGANMGFICQVPENFEFPINEGVEAQPNGFSDDCFCLFLGNVTYVFACEAQCDPRAVFAVLQN